MALKLNKISDAAVIENIADDRERLKKFLAADAASPMRSDPVRYAQRMADAALQLGLGLYQQEGDIAEIRENFALAGKELFGLLSLHETDMVMEELEFEKALALAVCFCSPSVYAKVDKMPESKFRDHTPIEAMDKDFVRIGGAKYIKFFAILVKYLNLARHFIVTSKLDTKLWEEVVAECKRSKPKVDPYDAKVNLVKLNALKALADKDSKLFNESIAALIKTHENSSKLGQNRRSSRGFICFPALMLAQLSKTHHLKCTVESVYLPLQLLK